MPPKLLWYCCSFFYFIIFLLLLSYLTCLLALFLAPLLTFLLLHFCKKNVYIRFVWLVVGSYCYMYVEKERETVFFFFIFFQQHMKRHTNLLVQKRKKNNSSNIYYFISFPFHFIWGDEKCSYIHNNVCNKEYNKNEKETVCVKKTTKKISTYTTFARIKGLKCSKKRFF